ncbi:MAG: ABC transporter substrate-binding protein [Thermoplasmata archaeon]|nr:ABC transporter substrate-binding protein [Thermoplasmata archaeon]
MLVVIVLVGAAGYAAFAKTTTSGGTPTTTNSTGQTQTCEPATSPYCTPFATLPDIALSAPFKTVQQGSLIPLTAQLPSGQTSTKWTFFFGDGSNASSTIGSASHIYTAPGTYIVTVTATSTNGVAHDNYKSLLIVTVAPSYGSASSGNIPGVAGKLLANSSAKNGATAVLVPGGSINVTGSYTSAPTNPLYSLVAPALVSSGGVISHQANTTSSQAATITFGTAGTFLVTFVGKAVGPGGVVAYENYTWTAFVAPSGVQPGLSGGTSTPSSPHKNQLVVYEYFPGGSAGEDPAIDYETVGYEPILNVYQSLINYNGSQTGPTWSSYTPTLATCVPGSPQCQALYGSSLIDSSGNNYTFVINSASQFYDPGTQNHWGVYPTDVLFSVARTLGFSTFPCFGCNNGWILAQALLPTGNGAWDSLHASLNNTPGNLGKSVIINGTDCPAAAMTNAHGCVTFVAHGGSGGGQPWPYFLELIADNLGGSIVPCGWFSAGSQGAGIPYWTAGNSSGNGDHPCAAPGAAGWGQPLSGIPAKGWDSWEHDGAQPPFIGNVQWNMLGSGPYYMAHINPGTSYLLKANPAYVQNPYCTWTGCQPAVGQYAATVSVTWTTSQIPGEQAYQAGTADFATIPSTDTSLLLQLIQEGKVQASSFPSISIYFFPFDFAFNVAGTKQLTSNTVNVPSDFFSHAAVRQFLTHAYPYQTIQSTINTKSGIQYLFNYGGAIPQFMANYYPTNVSWPTGDPCSDTSSSACAAYWWAQGAGSSGPYADPELAACSTSTPCQFPIFGETGAPDLDQRMALWAAEINTLSGGKMKVSVVDLNFIQLVINSLYSPPYGNPMPVFTLGWAPDYPDPTDYMVPLYQADGSYTAGDAVAEQLSQSAFNASTCTSYNNYAWYSANPIPDNCQGAAYLSMQVAMKLAAVTPAGPARVLLYTEIESIANSLALYTYWGQANSVASYASWIDGTTLNSNVTIGGGADSTWYTIGGNGVY